MRVAEVTPIFRSRASTEPIGPSAAELAPFQDEPPQMPTGTVGKTGFLRVGFERRGEQTILADLDRRTPLMAQRVLYPEPALPDLAWLFMITTTGCVLQGDRLALEISLAPGARAHVTSQSATKVHSMDANCAVQTQSLVLADRAYLEFMPEPLIPHRRARYFSDTRISIATYAFSAIDGSGLAMATVVVPIDPAAASPLAFGDFVQGVLKSVSQVFLKASVLAALLLLAGLAVNSLAAAAFALGGAMVAVVTAHALGAESDLITGGLMGFSPVLTAIALGAVFYKPGVRTALYALLATVFTVIVQGAMNVALTPFGIPTLTAPFVLASWLFLLPRQHFGQT